MFRKIKQRPERLYLASPLLFGAAATLLAIIIAVFAANNLQREKSLMMTALSQEGVAILNLAASTSRTMLRRSLLLREQSDNDWRTIVQQAIESSADHPRIVSLLLVDNNGVIIADNDREMIGRSVSGPTLSLLTGLRPDAAPEAHRMTREREGDQVFQIAAPYMLFRNGMGMPNRQNMRGMGHGRMGQWAERPLPSELQSILEDAGRTPLFLVAELDLGEFHQAVRKQQIQVGVLSFVLLLVGVGGILSLMMLQGLRGSQMRLSRMQEFTELLVSSLPVGLIATGGDDRIRTCNPGACRMLGLTAEEVLGMPIAEVLPNRIGIWCSQPGDPTIGNRCEMHVSEKDGTEKSLFFRKRDLYDADMKRTGIMVLIQDLSQIRELENELEKAAREAAIGRMAAGVAHEVRNPLSSIKGLALLLKDRVNSLDRENETADLLVAEVERLNRSIGELLDYARPAHLHHETAHIDQLVGKAVMLLRSDALSANVEITEQYQAEGCLLSVDQDKIIQVVLNLGLNAIQAMSGGGVLTVTTNNDTEAVEIVISDTGTGIEPALLDKVFDPYFTTKPEGTGLGLAMSKKIIEDHRGTLVIENRSGHGVRAVVRLPRK